MADILTADPASVPPLSSAVSDMPAFDENAQPVETAEPVDETVKPADIAATSDEQPDGEGTDAPDDTSGEGKDTPPWLKARITREANQRRAAEQRADKAEQQAADLAASLKKLTTPEPVPAAEDPRPARETFTDPDAYDKALIDWSARRATEVATKETEARIVQDQRKAAAEVQIGTYQSRVEAFRESHADYDDVVLSDDAHFSNEMTSAIVLAEDGPALAYHLASNPEVLDRIRQLTPVQQVYEIGKISLQLQASAAKPKPAPIRPIGNRSSNGVDPSDESMEAYGARRLAELRAPRLN